MNAQSKRPLSNDLGKAIVKGAVNDESKDTAVEFAEIGLDLLLDEGVLKEVPFLKTILSARNVWTAIHDQLFLRKVIDFIQANPKFTKEERESFTREHLNDEGKAKKLSDALVLILDRLDDFAKPSMLAKLFAALVRKQIDEQTFRRLAAAIDIGFADDLQKFATCKELPGADELRLFLPLLRTGLTEITGVRMRDQGGIGPMKCQLSELGVTFRKCMAQEVK